MNILIFVLYHISLFCVGTQILRKFEVELPPLLFIVGSFLVGMLTGIPVTYGLAYLLAGTGEPILWSVLVTTVASFGLTGYMLIKQKPAIRSPQLINISVNEFFLITFSLVFSTWLMFKTFHGGPGGQLFVGSNNVFDFGHSFGIIRSFSWGNNVLFASPFQAGMPFFYHFFFYFFVAIWEYFGVPVVWAMNVSSILSFSALLIVVYYFTQLVFHGKRLTGWIAVLLTITNSTLAFWLLFLKKGISIQSIRDIWRMPAYPFAGPFDGSTISIFMTLNNYVNQRHLAFAIAAGLLLILIVIQNKKQSAAFVAFTGLLTGLLLLWNIPVCLLVGCFFTILYVISRKWGKAAIFLSALFVGMAIQLIQYAPYFPLFSQFFSPQFGKGAGMQVSTTLWTPVSYLWQNLGILPVMAVLGIYIMQKHERISAVIFVGLFILLCLFSVAGNRGFDQKFLSFLIIPVNMIAAVAVVWVWEQKHLTAKLAGIAIVFILTISGFVDLIPVKNEFAYPFISKDMAPVVSWIKSNTSKEAVFVSYFDMIEPVVFAGRKNYYGFFRNIDLTDRSPVVSQVYGGDIDVAKKNNISYILVPKWQKSDFSYAVNEAKLRKTCTIAYEDDTYLIFKIHD